MMNAVPKKCEKEQKMKCLQYFTFYTNTLTQIDENRTLFEQSILVDVGGAGFPKGLSIKRAQGLYASFSKTLEMMDKKTIKEHKYEFNELWEGLPVDPLAKLLYDLDIDGTDQQFQEKMKKRRQVFEISNFNLFFSSLKKKEISQMYLEFLKLEKNSQPWEFILDLSQLKKYFERNKIELFNEKLSQICKTYIASGSSKQIKMENSERKELLKQIENRSKDFPAFKSFDSISQAIKLELQMDSFKRFTKSNMAKDVLSKYQHDLSVMAPISSLLSTYKDQDFESKTFSLVDFNFVSSILKNSSTWDSIYTTNHYQVSVSHVNWFPNVSYIDLSVVSYLYEYLLDFPMERVANAYFSTKKLLKIDPNLSKTKLIENIEQTDFDSMVTESEMIWAWDKPMVKKNLEAMFKQQNSLVFVSKPFISGVDSHYFNYEIIVLSERDGRTKFKQIICIYTKDNISLEKPAIQRANAFHLSLLESVGITPSKVCDLKENFKEMDKNGLPKDYIASLYINSMSKTSNVVGDELTSDDLISETSVAFDDDELTSATEVDFDDEE
jgi:hypothetical protein